jgi:predicted ATPase
MRRSAMNEALAFLRRGLDAVAQLPVTPWRRQKELELSIALGQAQIATQGYAVEGTRETFERALSLSEDLEGSPQLLSVMHGLYTHALMRADMPIARQRALAVLDRGRQRGDALWLLMGHRFSGVTHYPLGAFADAIGYLRRGLELYAPAHRAAYAGITVDDPEIVMLTYLSWSLMCTGEFEEARRHSARALEQARAIGHMYSLAHALVGAAFVSLTIDSPRAALVRIDEMLPLLEEHGIAYYGAVGLLFKGWCLASLGEHRDARLLFDQGMKAYRATGSRLYLAGFLRMHAEACIWNDDLKQAQSSIEESLALIEATQQRYDEGEAHRVRAAMQLRQGERDAAVSSLERAVAISAAQGGGLWELRATCDLAQLLAASGRRTQAREMLEPLVARHARQPALADVARLQALARNLA